MCALLLNRACVKAVYFPCCAIKRLDSSKVFRARERMPDALKILPYLMSHPQSYGLKINVSKTAILIRVAHCDGRVPLQQHLCKKKTGGFLRTIGNAPMYLPLRKSHPYLGCALSLYDFETLTVKRQVEMDNNQFSRLRSALTSQRCLSLTNGAYMWKVCVWTTLSYGLVCSGCTGLHLQQISGLVSRELRSIAKMPRRITQNTNEEVRSHLDLPSPAAMLQLDCLRGFRPSGLHTRS